MFLWDYRLDSTIDGFREGRERDGEKDLVVRFQPTSLSWLVSEFGNLFRENELDAHPWLQAIESCSK